MCVQSLGDVNASDWQLTELSADDVTEYSELVNEVGEAVTSSGVRHLRYVLTGLSTNTSYTARLRATNIFGTSDWSSELNFQTAAQRACITIVVVVVVLLVCSLLKDSLTSNVHSHDDLPHVLVDLVCLNGEAVVTLCNETIIIA